MIIREGTLQDLEELTEIEALCFPPEEAATRESFSGRLAAYPDCFWILEEDGKILSFVNGMCQNSQTIEDEMFEDPSLHNPQGSWQMIFGVNTRPEHRRKGYAALLLRKAQENALQRGRLGVVLTCKKELVLFYASLGFREMGLSESVHGGAVWYDMEWRVSC